MLASAALAYQILNVARTYWNEQRYPEFLDYRVRVDVTDAGHMRTESYTSQADTQSGRIRVDAVSDYELRHLASGRGVSFNAAPGVAPAPDQDFIGVPVLTPAYSFTLGAHVATPESAPDDAQIVEAVRKAFHDPNPRRFATPSPAGTAIPQIADVVTYARTYTVVLEGEETIGGRLCNHLSLTPLLDPGRNRLRDLWIDEKTGATIRAKIALNFITGPGTSVPWTIDFFTVGGAQYIHSETADGIYRYAGRSYAHVTITFDDITPRADPLPSLELPFSAYLKLQEPPG